MAKSKTIGGIRMTQESCSTSKTAATKKAKAIRAKGYTARVVTTSNKGKKTHCVFKGRKAKANATQKRRRKRA